MRRATRPCVDEAIRLATVSMTWRSAVTSVSTVFRAKGCNSRSTESGLSVLFRCIVTTLFWTLLERPRRGTLRDSGIAGSPRSTAGAAANPCDSAGAAVLSQSAAGPQHQQLFSHCLITTVWLYNFRRHWRKVAMLGWWPRVSNASSGCRSARTRFRRSCAIASARSKASLRGHWGLQATNVPNADSNRCRVLSMAGLRGGTATRTLVSTNTC